MQHASAKIPPRTIFAIPKGPATRSWVKLRRPLLALGGFVLLLGVVAALQLYAARGHLLEGARAASAAETLLRNPLQLQTPQARASLRLTLSTAHDEFARARQDLFLWTPLLPHVGWVPGIGSELAAAPAAADISYRTTDAGLQLIDGLPPVLQVFHDRHMSGSRLPRLTVALATAQPAFARAHADMQAATADLRSLPASVGNARVDTLLGHLRSGVPKLNAASAWLALAPDLLGAHHPVQYLFAWQNPAELRATGGFLGASDLLTVDHGNISHQFYGHGLPRQITWPAMPLPEEVYTPESTWLFEDSNWSPDFPLSARFERWFYGEDTGHWASGVINFLDTAAPDLLQATGPVYLPEYRRWVSAQTVNAQAEQFVNVRYRGPQYTAAQDARRKHFFFAVLQGLLARAQHLPVDRLPTVLDTLQAMIRRGDLQLYHQDPAVEGAIAAARADGRLMPGSGDYVYIVDDNRSYNKINPYIREQATYTATVTRGLWIDARLTLRYHVLPSPANIEGYGPNWGLWGTNHDYQDFVRVYVPLGSELQSMSGLAVWTPRIAYGATQFAGRLLIREGQTATVVIRYWVPANVFEAGGTGTYRLRIQHQPGGDMRSIDVAVRGGKGVMLQGGSPVHVITLPLDQDTGLQLGVGGNLDLQPTKLPALPAQPDPYIQFVYLHDPRHPL
jgi:hypothetical protein